MPNRISKDGLEVKESSDVCPIEATLDIIGKKWTILILRELFAGPKRFTDIAKTLPISTKLLTHRLRELEERGIVHKTCYAEMPPRVEYTLTASGRTLECVLAAMREWGSQHLKDCQDPSRR
jgi:DNA-binding HxlR family transcriptional regulator